jgi:hypothetical protein
MDLSGSRFDPEFSGAGLSSGIETRGSGVKRKTILLSLAAISLLAPAAMLARSAAQPVQFAHTNNRHVLLLIPGPGGRPMISEMVQKAEEQLILRRGPELELDAETIDPRAQRNPQMEAIQKQWLQTKYAGQPIDMVIALGASVLPVAEEMRSEMWPEASIVFCCLDRAFLQSHPSARTTGIFAATDWAQTVRFARQLFPRTRHIALVGGDPEPGSPLNDLIRNIVREQKPAMDLIDLSSLPLAEQLRRSRELPPYTVILYMSDFEGASAGKDLPLRGGYLVALARDADVPVFIGMGSSLNEGGVGGYVANVAELGRETGNLASSILAGETPPDAPPLMTHAIHLRVSRYEIDRWRIPSSRIPDDAAIQFASQSLWRTHRGAVIAAVAVFAGEFAGIFFLILALRRRRASKKLHG